MTKYKFAPLLYLNNGNLLAYKNSELYLCNSNTFQILRKYNLRLGWKEKYFSRFNILFRIFRLGIRNAIQLDDSFVILFSNNRFYEANLDTGHLEKGFIPPIGIRALNITAIHGVEGFEDSILFGAYINPFIKIEIPIYRRKSLNVWEPIFTFKKGLINHIHNIIPDKINNCVWILTGDFDGGAAIWKAKDNFNVVELILSGSQTFRSCVAFPFKGKLIYATDSPFHQNSIRVLENIDGKWVSNKIMDIAGSCIYGCEIRGRYVFSTAVEPDGRNPSFLSLFSRKRGEGIIDQYCHLYFGNLESGFNEIYKVEKDYWPYPLCQFGTLSFASGENKSDQLLVYHIATRQNDCSTIAISLEK